MLYHDACRYAHLFLYEYQRRFEPYHQNHNEPYIKPLYMYQQVVDSVFRYGDIPLGDVGYIRHYADKWIRDVNNQIAVYHAYSDDVLFFREAVYIALETTFLYLKTTGILNHRKTLRKAVDEIIPSHL